MSIAQDGLDLARFFSPEFEEVIADIFNKSNSLADRKIDKDHFLRAYHVANTGEASPLLKHHILSVCEIAEYLNHLKTNNKFDPAKAPPIVPLTLLKGLQEYSTKAVNEFDRLQSKDKGILEKMSRLKNQVPER